MPLPRTEITIFHREELLLRRVLTPGQYIVGSDDTDLQVDCPGISPKHLRLSLSAHLLTVEDLGSEEGSFINNRRIEEPVRLFPNQRLKLGPETELAATRLREDDDPEASCSIQQAYVDRLLPPELRQRLKYEVNNEVGRGGMGTVFCAREMPIRREVAMKVMLTQASESAVARFIKEAQVTGQLEHPNIVPIHELGVDEHDQLFYTMKYVRGITLKEALARLGYRDGEALQQFTLTNLLSIFDKVADAVAFAHSRRVVHRDLKPENIMIGKFGEVLVMDWGLSSVLPEESISAKKNSAAAGADNVSLLSAELPGLDNAVAGTPQYMAPEQARGELRSIGVRSDIYSLGAILFHILFLEKPIGGEDIDEVLENVRAGRTRLQTNDLPNKSLPHHPGQSPPVSLIAVARKAMALAPGDRYASVKELQADIRNYSAGFATEAEKAGVRRQLLLGLQRYRREAIWGGIFLAVLAVFGTSALVRLLHERKRTDAALAQLRATAPSFIGQARMQVRLQDFAEARKALDYALLLQPNVAEAHLLKADILQAEQKFEEAAVSYREAARLDPAIQRSLANAQLSERLAASVASKGTLSREEMGELFEVMVNEGRLPGLLLPLSQILGRENALTRQVWRDKLNQLASPEDRPWDTRLIVRPDGQLELDLSDTAIAELSPIADMPIRVLNLRNCEHLKSIAPLQGMPLRSLILDGSGVTDLSPLKELKLEDLSIAGTGVTDLTPLAGSSLVRLDCSDIPASSFSPLAQTGLETLSLAGTSVGELWFLRGLPLRVLRLDDCPSARGYSALLDLENLEVLTLPKNFYDLPVEELPSIRALSRQPRLRQILAEAVPTFRLGKEENSEAFWKQWEPELAWLEMLRRGQKGTAERLTDGSWSVSLRGTATVDLGFLKGAKISKLDLFNTAVMDLKPLAGMPLQSLDIRLSKVADLGPLRGMPLKELLLWRNAVTDFTPISTLAELEVLDLTETPLSDLTVIKVRRLKMLRLGSTKITDLSPLAGMFLEKLHCDAVEVTSIRPLLKCEGLRWLIPPVAATDIEVLRGHPTLERISYFWNAESEPTMTAEEFWKTR
ncbi:protein kinase [Luteolibacter sp. GHJ8]|uniref:Protein kinase n=1 Tax=Luteolibacter rhizosphaerae TaxID=2989719 RepID=A0ABT3GCK9_9BACT|nr:protein kinase [Luteolibacter rhizosphaerae]MCW1916955.1 protein kinase [Luteolibacter rhizosphaerae]